ncbi:methionyl-tRNA formyltransferase, partial [Dysosmobacter welbionis]
SIAMPPPKVMTPIFAKVQNNVQSSFNPISPCLSLCISVQAPDGHLAGPHGLHRAVRPPHHQAEFLIDVQCLRRLAASVRAQQPHGPAQIHAPPPVLGQIRTSLSCRQGCAEAVHLPDDLRRQGGPGHSVAQGLDQGGGDLPHLGREILRPLGDIDSDAQHQLLHAGRLPLQGELGQNTAELFPIQHRIVGPFQAGADAAQPLYGPTHRYSSHGRHRRQPLRRQIRPQQGRQVDPLAAGGLKAPAQSAPASRLAVRHHHSAVRCALRCQLSGPEIGGVHLCQTHQGPAHPGRLPQKAADLRLRQHV